MNCMNCGAFLADKDLDYCPHCGCNVLIQKKVEYLSKLYYNQGLETASIRDLSGAVNCLKQSLTFNKRNIQARNLLGLVYFETGEVVAALSEWVISKNFQEKNNDADQYMNAIQSTPNKLDSYNQTIKKYNSALYSAQHGDGDMAIIQLKKVVSLNPKFVRAHQLLALLYMMSGKKDQRIRAKRLLTAIQKVDVTNTTTIRYLEELSDVHLKGEPIVKKAEEKPEPRKTLPRVDVDAYKTITPYKEEKPSVLPFINVIVGVVVIGIALMGFLIIPHIQAKKTNQANSEFNKYSEEKATNSSNVSTLKNEKKQLEKELETLKKENDELKGGDSGTNLKDSYEALALAIRYFYDKKDYLKTAQSLKKVNVDSVENASLKKLYNTMKDDTYKQASTKLFEQGRNAYNGQGEYVGKKDYDKAIEILTQALEYDDTNVDAMYFLGRCYQQKSDEDKAKEYYNKIINDYSTSARAGEAKRRLRELGE